MKKKLTNVLGKIGAGSNDASPDASQHVYSCYEGGTRGICSVCNLSKINCNCQHCRSCNAFLMTLRSRHHCRICWRPFCPNCSRKQRVSNFVGGGKPQPARVCNVCAVPQGLIHVSGMFDSYDALRQEEATHSTESGADSASFYDESMVRFHWGLYALLSETDLPRRCTNPSCATYLSYDAVCGKCKMPTVTCALYEVRSVDKVAHSADSSLISATESTVGEHRSMKVSAMAAGDLDVVYRALLPNRADHVALHGLRENTWAARKVLLSRIAVTIAGESQNCPNISLAMAYAPDARLLRICRVEPLYTVLECPGAVRFFAFAPTTGRKAMERRLAHIIRSRQVWSTGSPQCIGIVCKSEADAKVRGGKQLIGEFGSPESLLAEVEEGGSFKGLKDDILGLMQGGVDVVLCGHSTGGSIAALLTAHLLLESTNAARERLLCVTYGAPLVANKGLTDILESDAKGSLCANFQHFVHGSDVLPRMTFLPAFLQNGTMGTVAAPEEGIVDLGDSTNIGEVRDQIIGWLSANPHGTRTSEQQRSQKKSSKKGFGKDKKGTPSHDKGSGDGSESNGGAGVINDYSESEDDEDAKDSICNPVTAAGDIFAQTREPFDNNRDSMQITVKPDGEVSSPLLQKTATAGFETTEYRTQQLLDPFGCYNILWCGQDMYVYSDDPTKTLAILSERNSMRVLLKDHLMASYERAIMEYLNAAA